MIRPVVGITCQFDPSPSNRSAETMDGTHRLPDAYVRAVREAGGLPILLPTTHASEVRVEYLRTVDALIFSGGGDLDPYLFGEDPIPALGDVDPLRDEFELGLCEDALDMNLPILGICKGSQVINLVAGGTVIQDIADAIPDPIQHRQRAAIWYGSHRVEIASDSLLCRLMNTNVARVNSFHHQSIGEVAQGFRAVAHTADGVIEAIESIRHEFVVGVQWHPEGMFEATSEAMGLFTGLIEACRNVRERVMDTAIEVGDQPL
ncbi:MAG: gamma-glutamyl-gamma-aminobutyrate hydrolase family protein [Candidatus Poribacteria bacterium]|nr:gamma-glutamyl-gamma-aminobutyrate hydrolase family protein [Candidatus Poribacteria bacterium]